MAKRIQAEIIVDSSAAVRGFRQAGAAGKRFQRELTGTEKAAVLASTSTRKLGGTLGKIDLKGLAAGFAGGAGFVAANEAVGLLTETFKSAVEGAASLQKSGEAIDSQFGTAGESIKKFAEGDAAKLGISANVAEAAAARFGLLFSNIGIGKEQGAAMTVNMLKLAGAIASIKGIDASAVIKNLSNAMAGNTRGLKALDIVVTSTMIKQTALRMGWIKQGQALTPGIRAMAIYKIATAQLGQRMQEAGMHSGDLSDRQARLGAQWSNMKDQLGAGLIPMLAGFTGGLLATLDAMQKLGNVKQPSWLGGGSLWSRIKDPFGLHPTTHKLLGVGGKKKKPPGKPAPAFTQAIMDIRAEYQTGSPLSGYVVPAPPMAKAELPRSLQLEAMKAQLTKSLADDLKFARAGEAFFRQQLGLADEGSAKYKTILTNLVAAHQSVESITGQIQSQQDAHDNKVASDAEKQANNKKKAAARVAAAAKKAAKAAKAAAAAAKQALQAAVEQEKQAFGELFQGSVLNPSEDTRRTALGAPLKTVNVGKLTADLVSQNKAFAAWQRNLARLRKQGAPKALITELVGMGPASAAPQVAALAGATPAQRAAYFAAFKTKQKEIQGAAKMDVKAQHVAITAAKVTVGSTGPQGGRGTVTIHVHGDRDPQATARLVMNNFQRLSNSSVAQTRGRNGGHNGQTGFA